MSGLPKVSLPTLMTLLQILFLFSMECGHGLQALLLSDCRLTKAAFEMRGRLNVCIALFKKYVGTCNAM